ncbi:MAG TPA: hypothetical protein VHC98_02340 [Candidatus Saccharimonadales bacterium]|nr:hypothetical protein [Candidatus Saccharimonadales bacterium]
MPRFENPQPGSGPDSLVIAQGSNLPPELRRFLSNADQEQMIGGLVVDATLTRHASGIVLPNGMSVSADLVVPERAGQQALITELTDDDRARAAPPQHLTRDTAAGHGRAGAGNLRTR